MTEALYYQDVMKREFDSEVVSCKWRNDHYEIELKESCFYPEGGGQPADRGLLNGKEVYDVHEKEGCILHYLKEEIAVGEKVHGEIDFARRFDAMQQHSAEHIVSGLICAKYGCDNVGFHLGEETVTVDYNTEFDWPEALEIEKRANEYIWKNVDTQILYPSSEELEKLSYRYKKELTGQVRIVSFPKADTCACCGTHVRNSGEIGIIKFVSLKRYKGGVRMEMLAGKRAYEYLLKNWQENQEIGKMLSAHYDLTSEYVKKSLDTLAETKRKQTALFVEKTERMAKEQEGKKDVCLILEEMDALLLRNLADSIHQQSSGYTLLFAGEDGHYLYVLLDDDDRFLKHLKAMNETLHGKGGGKNGFAQGSLNCSKAELESWLEAQKEIL